MNMYHYAHYNAITDLYYEIKNFLKTHSESELSEIVDKAVGERNKNEQ